MITTTLREKVCKHCGLNFMPARAMQNVCSRVCAGRLVKATKKAEIQSTRARREALKTIPDLIREAQAVFNRWVRARDDGLPCISCGKHPGEIKALHSGRDAGHYRSIGTANHLRFHPDNCHAQCVHCNQWKAGNAVDYRLGLIARIGLDRVEALEMDNNPVKWLADELRAIKALYRSKLKQMEDAKS